MEQSKIEWLDGGHTWSPWIGCQSVSAGCDNCYAQTLVERFGGDFGARRQTSLNYWRNPHRWNERAQRMGIRTKVFPSMCDPFDNQVPTEWRADMWAMIEQTPNLDWLLLTKRPQNIPWMLPSPNISLDNWFPNVWLGASVENQVEASRRIPHLLSVPAAIHFLSCEPLLGHIDLGLAGAWAGDGVDWVIAGGESGPKRRRVDLDAMRDIRDQCVAAGVPFFSKQDDKVHDLPADLMIREYPHVA